VTASTPLGLEGSQVTTSPTRCQSAAFKFPRGESDRLRTPWVDFDIVKVGHRLRVRREAELEAERVRRGGHR
jgi:hypothetical protein